MDARLRDFAATDRQREVFDAVVAEGGHHAAARFLKTSQSNVSRVVKAISRRAAAKGMAPGHWEDGTAPGYRMGKVTIQRSPKGVERVWERHLPEERAREEVWEAISQGFRDEVAPIAPLGAIVDCDDDLLTIYPQGDPHAGMRAWAEETDNHFDLAEYERTACAAIDRLVDASPRAALALFNDKGDTTHADNNTNRTPGHGNQLDVEGRHTEVVRVNVRVKRYQISRMLERHQKVIVRIDPGNHDPETALHIAMMLEMLYEQEPRVEVITTPNPYWYFEFGQNLIGTTHGDGAKGQDLPLLMASDVPEMWGRTMFRLWLVGHIHHKYIKEYTGCVVEYVRTLAGKDAWHHGKGYRSARDMQAITVHRDHGEVERHTCGLARLRAA
jgi:hypothetical protein